MNPTNRKLTDLLRRRPVAAGGAALGMAFFGTSDADAALQITDIGVTITADNYELDLDGGGWDFRIHDTHHGKGVFSGSIESKTLSGSIFANDSGDAILFSEGDTVGPAAGGILKGSAQLYSDPLGPLFAGSSGYIGLVLDNPSNGVNYGWVQIQRGSAIIKRSGFETDSDMGALIPLSNAAIPEPASMAVWGMLATGAAGMAALRRRRRERTA